MIDVTDTPYGRFCQCCKSNDNVKEIFFSCCESSTVVPLCEKCMNELVKILDEKIKR